jgi:hypothetical protein
VDVVTAVLAEPAKFVSQRRTDSRAAQAEGDTDEQALIVPRRLLRRQHGLRS